MTHSSNSNQNYTNSRSTLRRVLSLLKDHKGGTILLVVLIVASSLLEVFVPFLTQRLIDVVVLALRSGRVVTFQTLLQSGLFIFVSVAVARVLRGVYNYRSFRLMGQVEDDIKSSAFANFLDLDMVWHSSTVVVRKYLGRRASV
jgi:ABC-type multidrug transport system fused ATPase/permease subunit